MLVLIVDFVVSPRYQVVHGKEQRLLIVKTHCTRMATVRFSGHNYLLNGSAVRRLIKQFKEHGLVQDFKSPGRPRSGRRVKQMLLLCAIPLLRVQKNHAAVMHKKCTRQQ